MVNKRLRSLKRVITYIITIKVFMIYGGFESTLVPRDNGKQNTNESYTNNYQKHVACSYGYKYVFADDKFNKIFKSY